MSQVLMNAREMRAHVAAIVNKVANNVIVNKMLDACALQLETILATIEVELSAGRMMRGAIDPTVRVAWLPDMTVVQQEKVASALRSQDYRVLTVLGPVLCFQWE